jgi:hypothetical protein
MVSASADLTIRLAMESARRQAMEDPMASLYALHGVPPPPVRAAVPERATQPWARRPPRELAYAQPARWAELRAQRDPQPEIFEGLEGMASWHRAAGWPVERALRESPADCWWFDPACPIELMLGGFPRWDKNGRRDDTGEDAQEFADLVEDYERELTTGTIFPPMLVVCIEPEFDRPAMGLYQWICAGDQLDSLTPKPHYSMFNGRHRACAAYRVGIRTFPAFVVGPAREKIKAHDEHGPWFLPVMETAREKGRTGLTRAELTELGPVRIDPGAG